MAQELMDARSVSYRLWRQALSGDPEGALLALEEMDWEQLTVLSADLLARLYVREHRLADARAVWQRILQVDPQYAPGVTALRKLDSPWLVRAVVRKYSLLFGVGILLLFALYGLGVWFLGDEDVPSVVMGMATVLAVLGIYLAGLFGWAYMAMDSLFGSGRSVQSH